MPSQNEEQMTKLINKQMQTTKMKKELHTKKKVLVMQLEWKKCKNVKKQTRRRRRRKRK